MGFLFTFLFRSVNFVDALTAVNGSLWHVYATGTQPLTNSYENTNKITRRFIVAQNEKHPNNARNME